MTQWLLFRAPSPGPQAPPPPPDYQPNFEYISILPIPIQLVLCCSIRPLDLLARVCCCTEGSAAAQAKAEAEAASRLFLCLFACLLARPMASLASTKFPRRPSAPRTVIVAPAFAHPPCTPAAAAASTLEPDQAGPVMVWRQPH